MRSCKSRPLRSGSQTSSTRQLGESGRGLARNSVAEENVCGRQPAESISNFSDRRTETSSSTTYTMGVPCDEAEAFESCAATFSELGDSDTSCLAYRLT